MTEEDKQKYRALACNMFLGGVLMAAGFLIHTLVDQQQDDFHPHIPLSKKPYQSGQELRSFEKKQYDLINPLLECGELENVTNKKVEVIKNAVGYFIQKSLSSHQTTHISVYFRDLNNGPWFGFNEKETFVPGSLLKVPLLMALYKEAMQNPSFLDKKIMFESGAQVADPYFKPEKSIKEGSIYSVQDLIEYMIEYSDNNATLLLSQLLNEQEIESTYSDFGINIPRDKNYTMSVRTYASFFRILFNATYLDKEYSNKALNLLTESAFKKGIRAPIPSKTPIAHKFGERTLIEGQENQLHDCGIVYYPGKPYLLCIMTRGNDYDAMSEVIQEISKIVYTEFKKED